MGRTYSSLHGRNDHYNTKTQEESSYSRNSSLVQQTLVISHNMNDYDQSQFKCKSPKMVDAKGSKALEHTCDSKTCSEART